MEKPFCKTCELRHSGPCFVKTDAGKFLVKYFGYKPPVTEELPQKTPLCNSQPGDPKLKKKTRPPPGETKRARVDHPLWVHGKRGDYVLEQLALGKTTAEIGKLLGVTPLRVEQIAIKAGITAEITKKQSSVAEAPDMAGVPITTTPLARTKGVPGGRTNGKPAQSKAKAGFDKTAYQREYMRKRRAAARTPNPWDI